MPGADQGRQRGVAAGAGATPSPSAVYRTWTMFKFLPWSDAVTGTPCGMERYYLPFIFNRYFVPLPRVPGHFLYHLGLYHPLKRLSNFIFGQLIADFSRKGIVDQLVTPPLQVVHQPIFEGC